MDKRRYVRRDPGNARDQIRSMADDVTGNAPQDGFTSRYRKPLGRQTYDRSRSPYSEYFVCDGLMDENEAEMTKLYPYD